jgi:hypothetical protein
LWVEKLNVMEDGVYWQVGISYCENPADEKYETLGIFVPEAYLNGTDNMAEAFAQYINELGLKDSEGNVLVLTESEDGIYQAGNYYDYVKSEVERSLNNFLADTTFPYTAGSNGGDVVHGAGGRGNI